MKHRLLHLVIVATILGWAQAARAQSPIIYFSDDMEGDVSGWAPGSPWAVTSETTHSGSKAWSDSPGGGYARNTVVVLRTPPINLASAVNPKLSFWHTYYLAPVGDGGIIEADHIDVYVIKDNAEQVFLKRYYGASFLWEIQEFDLTPFAGNSSLRIAFYLFSLPFGSPSKADGWFIDDVVVSEGPPPGAFEKVTPSYGESGLGSQVTLSWTPSAGATSYEYCVMHGNNNQCFTAWTRTTGTSVTLSPGTGPSSWEVRALNDFGSTQSDNGDWWRFSVGGTPFNKVSPRFTATGQPLNPTLEWVSSPDATGYEYCVETTYSDLNNGYFQNCSHPWTGTTATSATLDGLTRNKTYWWQVRALTPAGVVNGNDGYWWRFTTANPAPGTFTKTSPATGTTSATRRLTWSLSDGATIYEYCVDKIDNNVCDTTWTPTPFTSGTLTGNGVNWWQVRARSGDSPATEADGGTWRSVRGVTTNDFDGDGKSDVAIFRASTGGWHMLQSSTNNTTSAGVSWGLSTDRPMPGDYDGDGKTDPTIFRPSTGLWAILKSSTNYTSSTIVSWGLSTDLPVPADYDGDAKIDPAIYRPSTGLWAMLKSSTGYTSATYVFWGLSTDVPMQGDYDGDGKADPTVFRPSTGGWYALRSSASYGSYIGVLFGSSGDVPVPADYDGDGKIDPAVFRPSTGGWYLLHSSTNYMTNDGTIWGGSGDVPVPGDFDGDGKTDLAVFTPSTGIWSVLNAGEIGLAHRWRLDEASGSVAIDALGDGSTDGALGPGAQRIAGHIGPGALRIDPSDLNGYVNIPGSVATFGASDFTISFWMIKTAGGFGALAGTRGGFDAHGNFAQFYANGSGVTLVIDEDTSARGFIRLDGGITDVSDGQWHRVTGVRAGPSAWLYVDGQLEAAGTAADGVTADLTTGFDFTMGVNDWERAHPQFTCGCRFDDVKIYNRALSPGDVQSSASEVSIPWGLSTDVPIGKRP